MGRQKTCDNMGESKIHNINKIETEGGGRIEWIDTAKGIAIILVVLGHIISSSSFLNRFISSFHMPLFFTLSGIFVVKNLDVSFKTHFSNRFRRLIIPYLIFGLFLLIPYKYIYFHYIIPSVQIPIYQRWFAQLIGLHNDWGEQWYSFLWFLPCLFCADLIIWSIWKYAYRYRYYLLTIIALVGILYYLFINKSLPFRIHTALIAVMFMALGIFLKDRIEKLSAATITVCFICYILCWYGNNFSSMVMFDSIYGSIYFSIPAAIFATVIVLFISRFAINMHFLSLLGKQSLMIYIIHQIFIVFIVILSKRIGVFGKDIIEGPVMLVMAICISWLCMKIGFIIQAKWPWMLGETKNPPKSQII